MLASHACIYVAIGWIDVIMLAMCLFVMPFAYVGWTGRGNKGVHVTWGFWFASALVHALCLPMLARIHELAYGEVPDAAPGLALGVALVAGLLGWIPGADKLSCLGRETHKKIRWQQIAHKRQEGYYW